MNNVVGVLADLFEEGGLFAGIDDDGLAVVNDGFPTVAAALDDEEAKEERLEERGLAFDVVVFGVGVEDWGDDVRFSVRGGDRNGAVDEGCIGIGDAPRGERRGQLDRLAQLKTDDPVELVADRTIVPAEQVEQLVSKEAVELHRAIAKDFGGKDDGGGAGVGGIRFFVAGGADEADDRRQRDSKTGQHFFEPLDGLRDCFDFAGLPGADVLGDELFPVGEFDIGIGLEAAVDVEAAETGGEIVVGRENGFALVGRGEANDRVGSEADLSGGLVSREDGCEGKKGKQSGHEQDLEKPSLAENGSLVMLTVNVVGTAHPTARE